MRARSARAYRRAFWVHTKNVGLVEGVVRVSGIVHNGIRLVLIATLAVGLALAATGCGMESSWSASPAFLGDKIPSGVIVSEAGAGETMEVGDEGEVVDVFGHIDFFPSDDEMENGYVERAAAITERTVCTLDGGSMEPAEFTYELLSLQDARAECNVTIKYASDEATEVSVEER